MSLWAWPSQKGSLEGFLRLAIALSFSMGSGMLFGEKLGKNYEYGFWLHPFLRIFALTLSSFLLGGCLALASRAL